MCSRQCDQPRLFLEKQRTPPFPLRAFFVNAPRNSLGFGLATVRASSFMAAI